jgi:L-ascorbate metabolism protein UlaG (beta-lactamase superfamily)
MNGEYRGFIENGKIVGAWCVNNKPKIQGATMKQLLVVGAILGWLTLSAQAISFSDPRAASNIALDASTASGLRDPACRATTLASVSGTLPRSPRTLAVRWTGFSNFELVYNGQVILLDAYYDRGSSYPSIGVTAAELKKADVILLGHGHYDHMSDAAAIGARTKATVVGAPVTIEKLMTQSIAPAQLRTVGGQGGELLRFKGFTVEPILARHGEPDAKLSAALGAVLNPLLPAMTATQREEEATIRTRGTSDPRVSAEGTIAYLITLDSGFRIMYRDSGGVVTDFERAVMARVGRVDLALTAMIPSYFFARATAQAMEYRRIYRPAVIIPAHHDAALTVGHDALWRTTEPVFQAMKDEDANLVTVSPAYREPVCFNTQFNISRPAGK